MSGGPLSTMIMNRNKPLHILGFLGGAISLMVIVTVLISTVMFMRNKKTNRILPNRRIRRRRTQTQPWLNSPFGRQDPDKFKVEEVEPGPPNPEPAAENINYNNNVSNVVRIWPPPPPPCAPSLPPPPPMNFPRDNKWSVPTVSANVPPKPKPRKKPVPMTRQDTVNKALVSELKLRLEQKRLNLE